EAWPFRHAAFRHHRRFRRRSDEEGTDHASGGVPLVLPDGGPDWIADPAFAARFQGRRRGVESPVVLLGQNHLPHHRQITMRTLLQDLRYAVRMLLKNPGFTTVAVLTLALGIGANTAIFQLLNAVRLKTLPVSKPHELIEVRIVGGNPGLGISDGANAELTYPLWEQIQRHREAFSGMFAWSSGELPIGGEVETRMMKCLWASGDFFPVLGVSPVCGRLFNADDDRRGAGPGGVVISYAFWQ